METFGQRLRRIREERGYGLNEFAALVGMSRSYLSRIETEKRLVDSEPRRLHLKKMAEILRVSESMLLGEDEGLFRPPRQLTERDLYERFGIKPYEQPIAPEGVAASAGPGIGVPQGLDESTPRRVKGSKFLWEVPILGNCMADEIKSGDVVLYNPRLSPEIGRIMVALRDEEELIIKRLKLAGDKQVLRPNHGKDVPVDERIRFLGRGVSVQRPLL